MHGFWHKDFLKASFSQHFINHWGQKWNNITWVNLILFKKVNFSSLPLLSVLFHFLILHPRFYLLYYTFKNNLGYSNPTTEPNLAFMNNAAMHIDVQVFAWTYAFFSLGYMPKDGIAELFSNSIFINVFMSGESVLTKGLNQSTSTLEVNDGSNFNTSSSTLIMCLG